MLIYLKVAGTLQLSLILLRGNQGHKATLKSFITVDTALEHIEN